MALENAEQCKMKIEFLQSNLSSKEDNFRDKIEKLISSHRYEVDAEVNKVSEILRKNYEKQLQTLQDSLQRSCLAYQTLETEFRHTIAQERKNTQSLDLALSEKEKALDILVMRDKEQTLTVAELVELVKELKSKLEKSNTNQQDLTRIHNVQSLVFSLTKNLGICSCD